MKKREQKIFIHDANNPNSVSSNHVYDIKPGKAGSLWIGTFGGGVESFNPATGQFRRYKQDSTHILTGTDSIYCLYPDHNDNLWIATGNKGIIKLNTATGKVSQFRHDATDTNSLASNGTAFINGNKKAIWIGTRVGLDRLEPASGKFHHYLSGSSVPGMLTDRKGVTWAGTQDGLFKYDSVTNNFKLFKITGMKIGRVISLNTDKNDDIWISSGNSIIEIKSDRKHLAFYNGDNGVHANPGLKIMII